MRGALAWLGLIALVSGCSGQADDPLNTFNVDETLTTENVTNAGEYVPPVPAHNYDFQEGDLYGYISAVSEEEQKEGKAAGDVVMYRYLGFYDSSDHLERVEADGKTIGSLECTRPCVAIKTKYFGKLGRTAFTPNSIVGAAFVDAQNGKLTAAPRRKVSADQPQSGSAGEQSAAVNQSDEGNNWTITYAVENGQ